MAHATVLHCSLVNLSQIIIRSILTLTGYLGQVPGIRRNTDSAFNVLLCSGSPVACIASLIISYLVYLPVNSSVPINILPS